MSRASALSLVSSLSHGQANAEMADRFYREALQSLGRQPVLVAATLVSTVAGGGRYAYPERAVQLLKVFYDDRDLSPATLQELAVEDPEWRTRRGTPIVYTEEAEMARTFRLAPAPDHASRDFIFAFGSPFGVDFPEGACCVLHTETRDDAPDWLDLPLALSILSQEYERDSPHRDPAMAALCRDLAAACWVLVL